MAIGNAGVAATSATQQEIYNMCTTTGSSVRDGLCLSRQLSTLLQTEADTLSSIWHVDHYPNPNPRSLNLPTRKVPPCFHLSFFHPAHIGHQLATGTICGSDIGPSSAGERIGWRKCCCSCHGLAVCARGFQRSINKQLRTKRHDHD